MTQANLPSNRRKVILCGPAGSGKTALLKKMRTNQFEEKYVATMGVEVHPIVHGSKVFNVWDCAGSEKFSGIREGYYIGGQVAIVMYNINANDDINYHEDGDFSTKDYVASLRETCGNIPIIICGNKSDLGVWANSNNNLNMGQNNIYYHHITTKNDTGIARLLDMINNLT